MSEETTETQATADKKVVIEDAAPASEPRVEAESEEVVTDQEVADAEAGAEEPTTEGAAEAGEAHPEAEADVEVEAETEAAEAAPEAEAKTQAESGAAATTEDAKVEVDGVTPEAETEAEVEAAEKVPAAEADASSEAEAGPEAETTTEAEAGQLVQPRTIEDLEKKMRVKGTVERLELYGAFIDIGIDTPALIHISKLGKNRVNRVSDALSVGEEVEVWVEQVDPEQNQVMVSMMEPLAVEWSDLKERQVYRGTVTRLENFGAFVDIGAEREGLVHISEMSHDYVKHPSEVVSVDDEIEVQVLGFNRRKRRIDLSMKALLDAPRDAEVATAEDVEAMEAENEDLPTAMEIAMRRAMQKGERLGDQKKRGKERKKRSQDDILSRTLKLRE